MNLNDIFKSILEKEDTETVKLSYYVIKYCNDRNVEITNLKLIKLLYFININYMLKNNGNPIFNEEFLAWRHGPVLLSVYDYFCEGIVLPSEEKLKKIFNSISNDKKDAMDIVLKKYFNKKAWDLVQKTHIKNGPWDVVYHTYKDENGICKKNISNKAIYDFYTEHIDAI